MSWGRRLFIIFIMLTTVGATRGVLGSTLEKILMPGKVIKGHEKYEGKCVSCHEAFSKKTQPELCLNCHKKVNKDIKGTKGFHGKNVSARKGKCTACHGEHKGRSANIVMFDRENFNHGDTDFPLGKSHRNVLCVSCHKGGKKYRDTSTRCEGCHKKNPHKNRKKKACDSCHREESWKTIRFDHGKTPFPLKGKHTKVTCISCHPAWGFEKIGKACSGCHLLHDVHGGIYGDMCEKCHVPSSWDKPTYDHVKTRFPLKGKHARQPCHLCHKEKVIRHASKVDTRCIRCHEKDDEHKGRYGKVCKSCHSPGGWKKYTFDHGKTKFPLKGKHSKVTCGKCHSGDLKKSSKVRKCQECHLGDSVHRGPKRKMCENCHNDKGWRNKVLFDHDVSSFPLIGMHGVTPCEECHGGGNFSSSPTRCVECHRKDDVHKEYLGEKCEMCHNPNGWRFWQFDHVKETKFPLDGAHKELECTGCHKFKGKGKLKLSTACVACHRSRDVHDGRFGKFCQRCHGTGKFKDIRNISWPSRKGESKTSQ